MPVAISNSYAGISACQSSFCDKDDLRTSFALAMSAMYKLEVPLYGDLVRIVRDINQEVCQRESIPPAERLDLERHGAIRLGTQQELHTVRRMFAIIGLYPVGYYDLSKAGLPMHATAFRPIEQQSLSKNPFRVFTTLLRPELLQPAPRELALSLLTKRNIFSDKLMELMDLAEHQGGLEIAQGEHFIIETVKTFRWHATAASTIEEYSRLQAEHPILADIACFNSAHINHLTPRTLDILAAEKKMKEEGLSVKSKIEGPPARRVPILLRQTSFLALQEPIRFRTDQSTELIQGHHKARFGEIEQRGAAVTNKGRLLYDRLLVQAMKYVASDVVATNRKTADEILVKVFEQYPDDLETLLRERLIFCRFKPTSRASSWRTKNKASSPKLSALLEQGVIEAVPLIYEDFLPLSAAGIFMSNLENGKTATDQGQEDIEFESFDDKEGFEAALGETVLDPGKLYAEVQQESLYDCAAVLGVDQIVVDH